MCIQGWTPLFDECVYPEFMVSYNSMCLCLCENFSLCKHAFLSQHYSRLFLPYFSRCVSLAPHLHHSCEVSSYLIDFDVVLQTHRNPAKQIAPCTQSKTLLMKMIPSFSYSFILFFIYQLVFADVSSSGCYCASTAIWYVDWVWSFINPIKPT